MHGRMLVGALAIAACGKSDEEHRAVSATDTAPGRKPESTTGNARPAPDASADGGAPTDPQHVKQGIGYAEGARRVPSSPAVRTGQPTVEGALDRDVVRRFVRRELPKLRACYEPRLAARETLAGQLTATFTIGADGTVRDARAAGLDPEVDACFAKVLGAIAFPKPPNASDVRVSYPFVLRPAME